MTDDFKIFSLNPVETDAGYSPLSYFPFAAPARDGARGPPI